MKINEATLPDNVQQPHFDRGQLQSRLVHLGFGAFHRAHQALFAHRVLENVGGDWGFCEVNLFGGEALIKHLREQDHLYTVLEKGADANQAIIVGSVHESLHVAFDGVDAILEKMAEPQVAIVSLTVTEKGYCMRPGGAGLDLENALIKSDLANPEQPTSAPGMIVAALHRRQQRGLAPFTVLSCDNIPENGHVVKQAVLGLAQAIDPDFAQWIDEHVAFPSTMVDRIVPAATEETLNEIKTALGGIEDPCGIACEPFIQWVVEENFSAGRPAWDKVGAQLVSDVVPFEEMKLRMLNGSHSFLAYLGYLAGYQHINDCMTDENYRKAAFDLMVKEQAPTLSVKDTDLTAYANRLIERYSNPSLKHRTWQIAMDGTQKLPQRMLDSVRWHIANGSDYSHLALGIAGWMRYVGGIDDAGQPIDIRDPMVEQVKQLSASSSDGAGRVIALLSLTSVFGEELPKNEQFIGQVTRAYLNLKEHGAKATVAKLVKEGTL